MQGRVAENKRVDNVRWVARCWLAGNPLLRLLLPLVSSRILVQDLVKFNSANPLGGERGLIRSGEGTKSRVVDSTYVHTHTHTGCTHVNTRPLPASSFKWRAGVVPTRGERLPSPGSCLASVFALKLSERRQHLSPPQRPFCRAALRQVVVCLVGAGVAEASCAGPAVVHRGSRQLLLFFLLLTL